MNEIIFIITISVVWGLFIWYVTRIPNVDEREHKKKSKKQRINE